MRKKFFALALCATVVTSVCCLAGCSKKIPYEDAYKSMVAAVENSEKAGGIFFSKERVNDGKNSYYTTVNVICDLDDYELAVDENGNYINRRIEMHYNVTKYNESTKESKNYDEFYRYVGNSGSRDKKNKVRKDYLFNVTDYDIAKKKHTTFTKTSMSADAYFESEEFKTHWVENKVGFLETLEFDDLDFTIKGAKAETNGNVTVISFRIKDGWFERNGIARGESLYGTDRIEVEMVFDRISYIYCYNKEDLGADWLDSEAEIYKYEVTYFGKKVDIPNYDEIDKETKQEKWLEI